MKTLNDIVDKMIKDYVAMTEDNPVKKYLKQVLLSDDIIIGRRETRLDSDKIGKSLTSSVDTTLFRVGELNTSYSNSGHPDPEDVFEALAFDYFLGLKEEEQSELLKSEDYVRAFYKSCKYYSRYLPIKARKEIYGSYLAKEIRRCPLWDHLMCIEDFDNVTDDQIFELMHTGSDGQGQCYEFLRYLFGDDRMIDLIVKDIEAKVATGSSVRIGRGSGMDITIQLFEIIAKKISDDNVEKIFCNDLYCRHPEEFLRFCMEDKRWFYHTKFMEESLANKIFENPVAFNDLQRYVMIIGRCCMNGNIPTYQAKRLKEFSALIQLCGYNFKHILPQIFVRFDKDGKLIAQELVAKPKANPDVLRYVIIKDGNIKIYKTKEERDEENVTIMGTALDLTKAQLRKKMDELLEN